MELMFMLAVITDGWVIGMWVVNIVISVGLGLGIAVGNSRIRKVERLEDRFDRMETVRAAQVGSLEKELETVATKLVEERFRAFSHQINNAVDGFTIRLTELKERLKDGEETFDQLVERDQKIELAVAAKFDQLKDFLRGELVSSRELDAHEKREGERFSALERQLREKHVG